MACKNNRLAMKIKSGEARGFGFTIKTNTGRTDTSGNPIYQALNLTGYTIEFQIKKYPYYTVEPIINKEITDLQDGSVGWITDARNGKFTVQITLDDLSKLIPEKDYYLIITLINGDTRLIISGEGDKSGVFRVCQS